MYLKSLIIVKNEKMDGEFILYDEYGGIIQKETYKEGMAIEY